MHHRIDCESVSEWLFGSYPFVVVSFAQVKLPSVIVYVVIFTLCNHGYITTVDKRGEHLVHSFLFDVFFKSPEIDELLPIQEITLQTVIERRVGLASRTFPDYHVIDGVGVLFNCFFDVVRMKIQLLQKLFPEFVDCFDIHVITSPDRIVSGDDQNIRLVIKTVRECLGLNLRSVLRLEIGVGKVQIPVVLLSFNHSGVFQNLRFEGHQNVDMTGNPPEVVLDGVNPPDIIITTKFGDVHIIVSGDVFRGLYIDNGVNDGSLFSQSSGE